MVYSPMTPDIFSSRPASGYWVQSRQPLASLLFIAPLLVVYETGVLLLGPEAARNGVDTWLRYLLELMGFGQYFLLPLLTVGILLSWHHTTRQPWRVSGSTLYGMAVESILLAVCLRLIWQVQGAVLRSIAGGIGQLEASPGAIQGVSAITQRLIVYLGAGIYEELLFRLILLSAAVWAVRWLGASNRVSMGSAIVATSLAFAIAHYVGPYGEPLDWYSFLFRFWAGVFFSLLFLLRGFGIAAGAHAGYDILVGLP